MTARDPIKERKLIVTNNPKRPYGAKIEFKVIGAYQIGELENVTILLNSGAIARIQPAASPSWEGGKNYSVLISGFPTASEAEAEGLRFVQALLLSAISLNFGLRLIYHTYEPVAVYDRFRSGGLVGSGEMVSGCLDTVILREITNIYENELLERKLIFSMELFCSAMLDFNMRTRFVNIVSAFEPLADQITLDSEIISYVDRCIDILEESMNIDSDFRKSLAQRVSLLKKESVRQALKRLIESYFPGERDIWKETDRLYSLRSDLLHNGIPSDRDIDFTEEISKVSFILRKIYEAASSHKLYAKPIA